MDQKRAAARRRPFYLQADVDDLIVGFAGMPRTKGFAWVGSAPRFEKDTMLHLMQPKQGGSLSCVRPQNRTVNGRPLR